MLHLRHNRFEDVNGIYLTGAGAFQSARISSKRCWKI